MKIILADDHRLFREGLRFVIETQQDLKVIAEVNNGEELIASLDMYIPDLILLDLKMPVMDGIEAIRKIRAKQCGVRIIVMSMHSEGVLMSHLFEQGANGFLPKNTCAADVIQAIRNQKKADS